MKGDDRVRFCELCKLNVYDFAQLTRREVDALVANSEGRLCGRLYRRADGTIITKDCPVGLQAIRRRVARISGAIFATLISLSAGILASARETVERSRAYATGSSFEPRVPSQTAMLSGTVTDPAGAVVQDATVTLTNVERNQKRTIKTDSEGRYAFVVSDFGRYRLQVEVRGFHRFEREVSLHLGDEIKLDAFMDLGMIGEVVIIKPRESGLDLDGVRVNVRNHEDER
jgi:hypothetical protein